LSDPLQSNVLSTGFSIDAVITSDEPATKLSRYVYTYGHMNKNIATKMNAYQYTMNYIIQTKKKPMSTNIKSAH